MQEIQETWVRSLGQEDPLEKEMVTHSSTLAWEIPWIEEPGGLQSTGSQESDMTVLLSMHALSSGKGKSSAQNFLSFIMESFVEFSVRDERWDALD